MLGEADCQLFFLEETETNGGRWLPIVFLEDNIRETREKLS